MLIGHPHPEADHLKMSNHGLDILPTNMTPSLVFSAATATPSLVFSAATAIPSLALDKPFINTSILAVFLWRDDGPLLLFQPIKDVFLDVHICINVRARRGSSFEASIVRGLYLWLGHRLSRRGKQRLLWRVVIHAIQPWRSGTCSETRFGVTLPAPRFGLIFASAWNI